MTQFFKILAAGLLAVLMTACGGGGGNPGASTAGGVTATVPGGTATLTVTDLAIFLPSKILNDGNQTAALQVVALNANRNVVPAAAVTVSTDQNTFFTPTDTGGVTNASGSFAGSVQVGNDKSDRVVTVSVTSNGLKKQASFLVVGSKLSLQATPPLPTPGQTVVLSAKLVDASGNPIRDSTIKLGGSISALQGQVAITDITGVATATFAAPTANGFYTVSASGSGVVAPDYQLQVFTSAIPPAVIPAGVSPSLAASPNVLAANSPGSTTNRSTLRFLFLDAANKPVQNVRVRFADTTTGLPSVGASISSGTSTLYTDASGTVSAQYISGQNSSPTNGVSVMACYSSNDFAVGTCPASVSASLTVAGQALAVSIGDDNKLDKGPGTYIKRFAITVADSAGRAVANAPVDISVDLTHYGKGAFAYSGGSPTVAFTYLSGGLPVLDPLQVVPVRLTDAYPSITTTPSAAVGRVWCPNEDINRNGNVDPGENIDGSVDGNGQPTLQPRKSDLVISYDDPKVTATDANGILVIKVEYSQRFATWLAYKIRVTANVSGSQGMAERLFVTQALKDDATDGSFLQTPYGFNSCSVAN